MHLCMCTYQCSVYLFIYIHDYSIYVCIEIYVHICTWQSWLSQHLNVDLSDPISAAGSATVLLSAMFPA